MRILLVEDDTAIAALVSQFLEHQYYVVDVADNGQLGWDLLETYTYDLVLLDVMLPKLDGMTLCRQLRAKKYQMPVILLTARDTSSDKVMGLDVGADDYLVKPFDLTELGARIRALLRRSSASPNPILEWGKLRLDPSSCQVTYHHQLINLSPKEYSLLELFLRNSRRVFSRYQILEHLWTAEDTPGEDTVKAHIKGLRQKLKAVGASPDLIETVYGMGYRLRSQPETDQLPLIVAIGLPSELTARVQKILGNSALIQVAENTEKALDILSWGSWAMLLVEVSAINATLAKSLEEAYSRFKQGKQSILYCLQPHLAVHLPKKLIGQLCFYPLSDQEISQSIAETLNLNLSVSAVEQATSLSATKTEAILKSVAKLWERSKGEIINRIEAVAQASQALQMRECSLEQWQLAIAQSHKLAGSLGTFGFSKGSEIARTIENLLLNEQPLQDAIAPTLATLVAQLQIELQHPPSFNSPVTSTLAHSSPALLSKQSLLIVEDDLALAKELTHEATAWGFKVTTVNSLTAARNLLQTYRPDLVLLDLILPEHDETGLNLLQELSQQKPPIPAIVSTVRDEFTDRVEVARLGGCAFLPKPIAPSEVMQIITTTLQQVNITEFRILVVDDDSQILAYIETLLKPWNAQVFTLDDPLRFWQVLEETAPDILILDINMPNFNGIELCRVIRNDPQWSCLPILFLSACNDAETIQEVFEAGADDYVSKPFAGPELVTRLFNRLERLWLMRNLADTDMLTGVSTRRKSMQDIDRLMRLASRQHLPLCLALLDIDYFKRVNDSYGHSAGDRVLQRLGQILLSNFRQEDVVARWGGEEFSIVLYGIHKSVAIERLTKVLEQFRTQEFVEPDGKIFHVTFSIGLAEFPQDGKDWQSLYRKADTNLYQAKLSGRGRIIADD